MVGLRRFLSGLSRTVKSLLTGPGDVTLGITAGLGVGLLALWLAPLDAKAFYAAAVQVVPVFLVALVLERSLVEMLGTESAAGGAELARVRSDWTPPSRVTRTFFNVERLLGEAGNRPLSRRDYERLGTTLEGLSDSDLWRTLANHEEPGIHDRERRSNDDKEHGSIGSSSQVGLRSPQRRRRP
jgi:hypothetical protein